MKYAIQISEMLMSRLEIEANSAAEARQIVEDKYYDGDIILSADDYVDGSVQIDVVGSQEKGSI